MMNRLVLNRLRMVTKTSKTPMSKQDVLRLIDSHQEALDKIDQLTYTQVRL